MQTPFSIVCLSSQDWHAELPTNRQQIMLRAARRGHRVLFLETGGFAGRHLAALLRRPGRASLARRLSVGEAVAPGIVVRKTLNLLPGGQKFRVANAVNTAVAAFLVRRLARRLPGPRVLWIYDPCLAGVASAAPELVAVYDCVDDYAEQVGGDPRRRAIVARGDERAAAACSLVFATTTTLYERHRRRNPRVHLVRNVGDFHHFAPAARRSLAAAEVAALPQPVIGFAGNFLPLKVDFELLEGLAAARPEWTLLLVGPAEGDAARAVRELTSLPNVRWAGPRPYAELPRYVAAFDVGLIPYRENAYTRSCFPLKLFEYLAAGKPVVATGLPELAGMEPDVALASGLDALLARVERALELRRPVDERRREALAAGSTWETRAERLLELVRGALREA